MNTSSCITEASGQVAASTEHENLFSVTLSRLWVRQEKRIKHEPRHLFFSLLFFSFISLSRGMGAYIEDHTVSTGAIIYWAFIPVIHFRPDCFFRDGLVFFYD